jgi:hypothetical protein
METNHIELVEMTPDQKAEFEAFKAAKIQKEEEQRKLEERKKYKSMIDEYIDELFPGLQDLSKKMAGTKQKVIETLSTAMDLKSDLFNVKSDQKSHTFTNSEGSKRIMIGNYQTDGYRDTVNEGIAIVTEVVGSLAKDDQSKALVNGIMRLLAKDKKGTLKASRVLELEQMAVELNNERLIEGVKIIKESYLPTVSKVYVKCEYKDETNAWCSLPLGITES